ncbi:RIX1 domain-containing protein [Mycena chlorophos]|uniref:Pre-rRNA-processing protein RIX1 n=1 Tax=Mycena chlorophos TaxID=658473 RepID=A0A8H6RWP2_MYCCL|nr:RIX1 domain-containing protein [Mycena chlorophos]
MDVHPLKTLLQLQLASDSSAVAHLPFTLASLTAASLVPSPHSPKWTARINSLLHAKTSDARWAGLCLAHKTAFLSQAIMIECAQSWIGVALPLLAKKEPSPVHSAAVRLLRVIFSAATEMNEFQRQVATPNVLKFTTALMPLAESHPDVDLKVLILSTLTRLIPLYPTLHRASQNALSSLCFTFLNGNPFKPPNHKLTTAASQLYAVLHLTGGKVGAANLWRKSVDDALAFAWSSFSSLRTTFLVDGRLPLAIAGSNEPLTSIPLNLDRLRCCIAVLNDLFVATVHRPIQVPLGALVKLALALVTCKKDEKTDQHFDATTRTMESAVTPHIWSLGCRLVSSLAASFGPQLTPHLPRLVSCLTIQLEQESISATRLPFLEALRTSLSHGHALYSTMIANRLAKAVLPIASVLIDRRTDARPAEIETGKSKKGKKRARDFEGDEVFRTGHEVVCPTTDDSQALFCAFVVLRLLLRTASLSAALQSIVCRVALSALLALPEMLPSALSPDPQFHSLLLDEVQEICVEFASASVEGLSKSLGLVVGSCSTQGKMSREIELLLHPRLPPLMRSMPGVEALSLFRAEESQEESDLLRSLGLVSADPPTMESQPAMEAEPVASVVPHATLAPPPMSQQPSTPQLPPLAEKPAPIAAAPRTALPPRPPAAQLQQQRAQQPKIAPPAPPATEVAMQVEDDEKNEEMPSIDLDSDSDAE